LLAKWMLHHGKESDVRALRRDQRHHARVRRHLFARRRLATGLSRRCLGSGAARRAETLGELVQRARDAGVQAMVEGPGHIPLDQIGFNMQLEQRSVTMLRSTCRPVVTGRCSLATITSPAHRRDRSSRHGRDCCATSPRRNTSDPARRGRESRLHRVQDRGSRRRHRARDRRRARVDDDLSRARAALNWPKQFELAFDGETARALHDEDLEVDTSSVRCAGTTGAACGSRKRSSNSRAAKEAGFQPERTAMRSPGVGEEGRALLRQRGALPIVEGKHACHSDLVSEGRPCAGPPGACPGTCG